MLVTFRVRSLIPGRRDYAEHDRVFDLADVTVVDRAAETAPDSTSTELSCWVYFRDGPHCQIVGPEAERFMAALVEHRAMEG